MFTFRISVIAGLALAVQMWPTTGHAQRLDDVHGELSFGAPDDLADSGLGGSLPHTGEFAIGVDLSFSRRQRVQGTNHGFGVYFFIQLPLDQLAMPRRARVPRLEESLTSPFVDCEPHPSGDLPMSSRLPILAVPVFATGLLIGESSFAAPKKLEPERLIASTATVSTSTAMASVSTRASVSASTSTVLSTALTSSPTVVSGGRESVVLRLVRAAEHAVGLSADDSLDDLASRARASALLPELRLRALRTVDAGLRLYQSEVTSDRATLSDGAQTALEARVMFRLDRLVFAHEEVALQRIRLERIELRQRIAHRVTEAYIKLLRAERAAVSPILLAEERVEAEAVAIDQRLVLDGLTGGAASKILREKF